MRDGQRECPQARTLLHSALLHGRFGLPPQPFNTIVTSLMEATTPAQGNPSTSTTPSSVKPLPSGDRSAASQASSPDATAAMASAAPAADSLLKRVAQGAHDAVDAVADRLSSTAEGVQGSLDKAGESRDEWMETAPEAIRQHPFAAVGTAVLIGLALRSLSASRDR